jgi:general secretion pathway protein K
MALRSRSSNQEGIQVLAEVPEARSRPSCGRINYGPQSSAWPGPARHLRSSRGFALVAVVWSLGLISLLGIAVMVGARYRTKVMSSVSTAVEVAAAAESAVNLGITAAVGTAASQDLEFPLRCRMPGGETATITIEFEAGKVDLNTATPAILTMLFAELTRDQTTGARIAGRVLAFRSPPSDPSDRSGSQMQSANGKPGDGWQGGFVTILQLDQIDGISPQLFHKALRFVTVRSKRPAPDAATASAALRGLLNLERDASVPTPGQSTMTDMTIRADVSAPDGDRFIREALVSIGTENGRPFVIREWRRGIPDSEMPAFHDSNNPKLSAKACFSVDRRSGTGS